MAEHEIQGSAGSSPASKIPPYIGNCWSIRSVSYPGTVVQIRDDFYKPDPLRMVQDGTMIFFDSGLILAHDTCNMHNGRFDYNSVGFTVSHVASSLAYCDRSDPSRNAIVDAVATIFTSKQRIHARVTTDLLALSVHNLTVELTNSGVQPKLN